MEGAAICVLPAADLRQLRLDRPGRQRGLAPRSPNGRRKRARLWVRLSTGSYRALRSGWTRVRAHAQRFHDAREPDQTQMSGLSRHSHHPLPGATKIGHMSNGVAALVKVGIAVTAVFALMLGGQRLVAPVQAPSLGSAAVVAPGAVPLQSPRSGNGPSLAPSPAPSGLPGEVASQPPRSGAGPGQAPLPADSGRQGAPRGGAASPLRLPLAGEDDDADDQDETLDDQDSDGESDSED